MTTIRSLIASTNTKSTWLETVRVLLLIGLLSWAPGCVFNDQSIALCQPLQVDNMGGTLQATCWSEERSVLDSVNRAELLGPLKTAGPLELFESFFSNSRDIRPGDGVVSKEVDGYRYRFSCPQAVDGKCQYELEVTLTAPLPAAEIDGAAQELVAALVNKQPDVARAVVALWPKAPGAKVTSINLRFERWKLSSITITRLM